MKNLKFIAVLFGLLLIGGSQSTFAQGKSGKAKEKMEMKKGKMKEKGQKMSDETKQEMKEMQEKI